MRQTLILVLAMLSVMACSKVEAELQPEILNEDCASFAEDNSALSIPVRVVNQGGNEDTKSYLEKDGTSWTYTWQDEDQFDWFQYRYGRIYNTGIAAVDKRETGTMIQFPSTGLRKGDILYAYLNQSKTLSNTDPSELNLVIPSVQLSIKDMEKSEHIVDNSFYVSSLKLDKTSNEISGVYDPTGRTPGQRTVSFKIIGYDPNVKYCCSGNVKDFKVDANGRGSVTVTFNKFTSDDITISGTTIKKYYGEQTASFKIYTEGNKNQAAEKTIKVEASGVKQIIGIFVHNKITYSYKMDTNPVRVALENKITEEHEQLMPVIDAMPIASKAYSLTYTDVSNPENINSYMDFYMLGSVAEFRLFSTDSNIGVGEHVLGMFFTTPAETPCAGNCTCNLLDENPVLTGFDECMIMSMTSTNDEIALGQENYKSLYMVLAPGSYSEANVAFITDQHVYEYTMTAKEFAAATKKNIAVDFANHATVHTLEEYGIVIPTE